MQTDRSTASARWVLTEFYTSPLVQWMCMYKSANEWLRPRRNGGDDMTHRHFSVSSRHSAVGGESRVHGYSSIRARSVASFRVCAIAKKRGRRDVHPPPPPPANSHRESRLYPCTTNGACCFDIVQTPRDKVFSSDLFARMRLSARAVLKNCWLPFNVSRAAPRTNCANCIPRIFNDATDVILSQS